jgi:phosphatidylglycerol---prolipoprotein diacylglyceryl transferase
MPWELSFPTGRPAFYNQVRAGLIEREALHSLPIHPSQIYAMLGWLVIMIVLLILRRREQLHTGGLVLSLVALYMTKRFVLDFFRGDYRSLFLGLNIMQLLAVIVIPICIWVLYTRFYKGNKHLR